MIHGSARNVLGSTILVSMVTVFGPGAIAQTTRVPVPNLAPSAAPVPGTRLGGPGRQPLGGDGSVRIERRQVATAMPAPTRASVAKSSFRTLADEIDRSTDPR